MFDSDGNSYFRKEGNGECKTFLEYLKLSLSKIKEKGYTIICADMSGKNIFDCRFDDSKKCLIIGSEANGVSYSALKNADITVSLPMGRIESLNAAVCASVMMYELKYNKK